ncbi:MAG: hypothetical protein NXI23_19710 [Bacteroidetes bacterium]|nr:hypothetical protein [Bacteroidota bacterium]MDF1867823.1 hypothetical protein [Saprospiraceae bacterium]
MKNLLILFLAFGSFVLHSQSISLETGDTYAVVVGISDYVRRYVPI